MIDISSTNIIILLVTTTIILLINFYIYFQFFKFDKKIKQIIPNYTIFWMQKSIASLDLNRIIKFYMKGMGLIFKLKIFSKKGLIELADMAYNLDEVKALNNSEINKEINKLYNYVKIQFFSLALLVIIVLIFDIAFDSELFFQLRAR